MRRGFGVMLLISAGCLRATTTSCASGAECPSGLACIDNAPYCGAEAEVAACAGQAPFAACTSAAVTAGVCVNQQCTTCSADLAGCATNGWQPMTRHTTSELHAIWVGSSTDAHAVGEHSTVLDYDGIAWRTDDSFPSGMGRSDLLLSDVWVASDGTMFVLGPQAIFARAPDGTWAQSCCTFAQPSFAAISGKGPGDVVAVGNPPIVLKLAGATWAELLPEPVFTGALIWHAAWYDGTNIFVAGSGGALARYDGAQWTPVRDGMVTWSAVWGSAADRVFAIGGNSASAGSSIATFDGSTWTIGAANANATLVGLTGLASGDLYAVGASGTSGIITKRTGTTWSIETMPSAPLDAVAATTGSASARDVFAVGRGGTILRYVGP